MALKHTDTEIGYVPNEFDGSVRFYGFGPGTGWPAQVFDYYLGNSKVGGKVCATIDIAIADFKAWCATQPKTGVYTLVAGQANSLVQDAPAIGDVIGYIDNSTGIYTAGPVPQSNQDANNQANKSDWTGEQSTITNQQTGEVTKGGVVITPSCDVRTPGSKYDALTGNCYCPSGTVLWNGRCVPTTKCPDGQVVPGGTLCPSKTCPDGQVVSNGANCPDKTCPDGTIAANGVACPEVKTEIDEKGQEYITCRDGSMVPVGTPCPSSGKIFGVAPWQLALLGVLGAAGVVGGVYVVNRRRNA